MGNFCEAPHLQISYCSLSFAEYQLSSIRLSILQGNIVEEDVDAIITISTPNLKNSNGFSRYIFNKAGKIVEEECNKLIETDGFLNYGSAIYTSGGDLPCEYIIHAIIPTLWEDKIDKNNELFLQCIKKCLIIANDLKMKVVSFPLLCSGIPGFPKEICVENMIKTMIWFSEERNEKTSIREIRIVNHDNPTVRLFEEQLKILIPEKKIVKNHAIKENIGFLKVSGYDKNKIDVYNKRIENIIEEENLEKSALN